MKKSILISLIISFILTTSILSACTHLPEPSNIAPAASAPKEDQTTFYEDNNRTNLTNQGFVCEDSDSIFYINVAENRSIYRFNKKTSEKAKLVDAGTNYLTSLSMAEGRLYFRTFDVDQSSSEYQKSYLCSTKTDGSDFKRLLPDVGSYVIYEGYFYCSMIGSDHKFVGVDKYSLDSGNSTHILTGSIGQICVNDDGGKLYYSKQDLVSNTITLYEYDVRRESEKALIITNTGFINYFQNAVYFTRGPIVYRYDLTANTVEPVSEVNLTLTGCVINSFVVSRLGIFFTATQFIYGDSKTPFICSLYKVEPNAPIKLIDLNESDTQVFAALLNNYILIISANSNINPDSIRAVTLKGEVIDLGL